MFLSFPGRPGAPRIENWWKTGKKSCEPGAGGPAVPSDCRAFLSKAKVPPFYTGILNVPSDWDFWASVFLIWSLRMAVYVLNTSSLCLSLWLNEWVENDDHQGCGRAGLTEVTDLPGWDPEFLTCKQCTWKKCGPFLLTYWGQTHNMTPHFNTRRIGNILTPVPQKKLK